MWERQRLAAAAALFIMAIFGANARAGEMALDTLLVPTLTIYPGRVIGNYTLAEASSPAGTAGANAAPGIKDIASVQGVRDNRLLGYGVAIGLAGSGDPRRNAPYPEQSKKAMLDHRGVNAQGASLRIRNVAGVPVTADLPAF